MASTEYMRKYRIKNRKKVNGIARRWYWRNREQAMRASLLKYAKYRKLIERNLTECERCGIKDKRVLQFHHTNPGEKFGNVSEMKGFPLTKVQAEIDKCSVLCANCHAIVEYENHPKRKFKEQERA